jgi:hypothetical protein
MLKMALLKVFLICTGKFLPLLTGSQRLVHRQLQGTYEFCPGISTPDSRFCLKLREVISFVDCFMALCFMASSAVHALEFVMICQQFVQLSPSLAIYSQLQSISSLLGHGVVYFRATCIFVGHVCEIQIC